MDEPIAESCSNVFADLGFPPEEASILHMRATLLSDLREHVQSSGTSPDAIAERLGVGRARVQDLRQSR